MNRSCQRRIRSSDLLQVFTLALLAAVAPQAQAQDPPSFEFIQIELLDARGDAGQGSSLAIDAQDRVHIAYYGPEGCCDTALKYARQDGADGWIFEVAVASVGALPLGARASLALDAAGTPHIAYHDAATKSLRLVSKSGPDWLAPETADSGPDVGQHASLALDGAGNPRVSYYDEANKRLKFAGKTGGSWQTETADAGPGDVGQYSSLALDGAGNPHISYHDATAQDLRYVRKSGASFLPPEIVDSAGEAGLDTSIALDSGERPHISSFSFNNQFGGRKLLKVASKSGNLWSSEVADSSPANAGQGRFPSAGTSLAFDGAGVPHVAFVRETVILCLFKDGAQWKTVKPFGGTDDDQDVSVRGIRYPSLAFTSTGKPRIAFQNRNHLDLKLWSIARAWRVEDVLPGRPDTVQDQAAFLALRDGVPSISFIETDFSSQSGLYVTSREDGVWSRYPKIYPDFETPSLDLVHSLALDAQGRPRVSYAPGNVCPAGEECQDLHDLLFAWWDPAAPAWTHETVATEGDLGDFQLLILEPNDVPTIVYSDRAEDGQSQQIRIARRVPIGQPSQSPWQVLPAQLSVSGGVSALGLADGRILLAHFELTPASDAYEFRIATFNGSIWSDELVESPITTNGFPVSALAHDAAEDRLVAAYGVGTFGKIAYRDKEGVWQDQDACILGTPHLGLIRGSWHDFRLADEYDSGGSFNFLSVASPGSSFCGEPVDNTGLNSASMSVDDREHLAYVSQFSAAQRQQLRYAVRTIPPLVSVQPPAQEQDEVSRFMFTFRQLCDTLNRGAPLSEALTGVLRAIRIPVDRLLCAGWVTFFDESLDCESRRASRAIDLTSLCQHVDELETLYFDEPQAAADVALTLENLWPLGEAVFAGRGSEVVISSELIAEAQGVLLHLSQNGSPELVADVNRILDEFDDLESFQGKTADQALGLLGASVIRQVGISLDLLLLASICGSLLLRSWWRGPGREPLR